MTNLVLSVGAWNIGLFEEPHIFLRGIEELSLESNQYLTLIESQPESDVQIQSQNFRSKRLSDASESTARSTELCYRQYFVLATRYLLAISPLTELILEKCIINKGAADALTRVIQNCTTLKTIELLYCTKESTNFTPILLAISKGMSIRYFTFNHDGRNLDLCEFDSLIRLIRSSRALRRLDLNDAFCSISHVCRALEALKQNPTISGFHSMSSGQYPPCSEPSEIEAATLNSLLLDLISYKSTLTALFLTFAITKSSSILRENALLEAFYKSTSLSTMFLCEPMMENRVVHGHKSISQLHSLNDLAANVVKIGRILSGMSLVCGLRLPIELIEEIMRQVTVESTLEDNLWRVIRRVAVDRRTIGRLLMNDEPFDAYELLYRCRSLM